MPKFRSQVEIRAGRDSFEDSWLPLRFAGLYALSKLPELGGNPKPWILIGS